MQTNYVFLQKPLVPASLDEVNMKTYWLHIAKRPGPVFTKAPKQSYI